MDKKIIKNREDLIKWQRMKRDLSASAPSRLHAPVRQSKSLLHSAKLYPLTYSLRSNFVKNDLMNQKPSTATGAMQVPVRRVSAMPSDINLHPSKDTIEPDAEKKVLEGSNNADQRTKRDVGTMTQLHIPVKRVMAVLSNPKLYPSKYSILPSIAKKVVEGGRQTNLAGAESPLMHAKERAKGSTPSRPLEDSVNITSKPVKKMTCTSLTLPMSPTVALKDFQDYLTNFEQKEILDFPEVWFLGQGSEKIKGCREILENSEDSSYDVNGIYTLVLHDHIAYRYEVLEKLGQGSFGLVLKCLDHKTKELVAVKVIHNGKSAKHMALKELEILDVIRKVDHENRYNVIHMKEHMTFRNHICIVFELQGMDLFKLIKKNNFRGFSLSQTHHYAASLVKSLQMLHRHKIIHCDLKPENILLSEKGHRNIKVADFGCSFYEHQKGYSYVQTRFYRAPEVILGLPFGTAIDMWSLGCILAELHTGIPLFSGANEVDQLACIVEVLGSPPEDIVQAAPRKKFFFGKHLHKVAEDQPRKFTRRQPISRDLASVLKGDNPLFLDFIKRCLTWDPAERMTADEAMQHKWLQKPPGTL